MLLSMLKFFAQQFCDIFVCYASKNKSCHGTQTKVEVTDLTCGGEIKLWRVTLAKQS